MLSSEEKSQLVDALCVTAEAMGTTLSPGAAKMMVDDLARFRVDELVIALRACRHEVTGRLTLAAIMQRVQAADGRPGKDEAWSIALAANDQFDTVVMTEEILLAMSVAEPVLHQGDKVGARMAFISAYERLVCAARQQLKPTDWHVSMGFDPQRRVMAIDQAVLMQRLSPDVAKQTLISLAYVPMTENAQAIAGLITGEPGVPLPEIRDRLRSIRDTMLRQQERPHE
ncbi:hypothetical protein BK666_09105 [Pseudomonas frederiksbergensis]|uniref:Uncharacterized protein n=1 Tax=Pseudomonas frederiksbergensis TaxID=104087 RepID=A0A423K9M2_9PSED|nr:hypothetical protein [Pseudomonas frederiksbergensis]RON48571.1 hypothetical protein BK666_09105 [Pseudomonas frederiksbergensis]